MVDEETDCSAALKSAATLVRSNQAHLTACAIVDAIPGDLQMAITAITPAELQTITIAEKRAWLDGLVSSVAAGGGVIESQVLVGRPFVEVIRQVLRNNYDLVIKCAEADDGLSGMLFGSTDMHLMRKCPCPVWIVKPTEQHNYRRILAAVDQDPEEPVTDALNRQILEMATSLALSEFSEAHIVHAWIMAGEDLLRSPRLTMSDAEVDAMVEKEASARRRWLEDLVRTYGNKADRNGIEVLEPQLHLIKGQAKHVVPEIARELAVDLVVMGTVARTRIAGFFMGNTAESILTQLDCSVLTVKPPGFVCPVKSDA